LKVEHDNPGLCPFKFLNNFVELFAEFARTKPAPHSIISTNTYENDVGTSDEDSGDLSFSHILDASTRPRESLVFFCSDSVGQPP
jgi:hypothetical protein